MHAPLQINVLLKSKSVYYIRMRGPLSFNPMCAQRLHHARPVNTGMPPLFSLRHSEFPLFQISVLL